MHLWMWKKSQIQWESLGNRNIPLQLHITAIMSMYKKNRNYVTTNNRESEEFLTKDGLRQGGGLSPSLCLHTIDDIMKEAKSINKVQV